MLFIWAFFNKIFSKNRFIFYFIWEMDIKAFQNVKIYNFTVLIFNFSASFLTLQSEN